MVRVWGSGFGVKPLDAFLDPLTSYLVPGLTNVLKIQLVSDGMVRCHQGIGTANRQ